MSPIPEKSQISVSLMKSQSAKDLAKKLTLRNKDSSQSKFDESEEYSLLENADKDKPRIAIFTNKNHGELLKSPSNAKSSDQNILTTPYKKPYKKEITVIKPPSSLREIKKQAVKKDAHEVKLISTLESRFEAFMESLGEFEKHKGIFLKPQMDIFRKNFEMILKRN
jgi:hypothetical protein